MSASLNINNILSQVKQMNKEEQMNFLQRLVLLLKKTEVTKKDSFQLTTLSGLGSEVWKNIDIDKYIEKERKW